MHVELFDGVYWVGDYKRMSTLNCNPYLILDENKAILIDPGSPLDFEEVFSNVTQITPLESIEYVILSHQDPDLCASLPLFEKKGLRATVVCHWRSATIIQYYDISSPFYDLAQNKNNLQLESGRIFDIIHAPYLHFPGAVLTYDTKSKVLFSGDLFGAFSANLELFADDKYQEAMEAFHEAYMPSNDILRPVMELLLNMDISAIAPQHGSVINKDVKQYIRCLRDLECGAFLAPIKKAMTNAGGYVGLCNMILSRYRSLYDAEELRALFEGTDIVLDEESFTVCEFSVTGLELWDRFFEIVYSKKGMSWITGVSPYVEKLTLEYDVGLPKVFESAIYNIEKRVEILSDENERLLASNERLENSLQSTQDKLLKDPVTGLYNEDFLRQYLITETENSFNNREDFAFLLIDLDNFSQFVFKHSDRIGNEALKGVAYVIKKQMPETHMLFKLKGGEFAYYIPDVESQDPLETAEKIRAALEQSESFVERITATIGLVRASEFYHEDHSHLQFTRKVAHISRLRVRLGKSQGMNMVCSASSTTDDSDEEGTILLVDTEEVNLKILGSVLRQAGYGVYTCGDGLSALEIIESKNPDFVICELMIPKLDGLSLRRKMLQSSELKSTHFILLSYQRNEKLIEQAFDLGIQYILKKPFMVSEILGIVRLSTQAE